MEGKLNLNTLLNRPVQPVDEDNENEAGIDANIHE